MLHLPEELDRLLVMCALPALRHFTCHVSKLSLFAGFNAPPQRFDRDGRGSDKCKGLRVCAFRVWAA